MTEVPLLGSIADGVRLTADRASRVINRYWYILAALFTIGYFSDALFRASRKLFWFDELFTLSVARLPDFHSLWRVLLAGIEFNPPLLYTLTGFSNNLLGESQVSARLPEIIGFWIFCLCLFRFVARRSTALGGFLSMLFPMVTLAYWYAYEARPYGIELGFCGLALICWQAAADRESGRLGWLLGLGIGLAGALLAHSYAFLIFVPLVMGEIARTRDRRRVDWPLWTAIAISSTAVLVSIPLTLALKQIIIPATVSHATLAGLVTTYISSLKSASYVLIGWLILMSFPHAKATMPTPRPDWSLRIHETVALLAFLIIPVLQALVAKLTGAPPIARYSICWIAGPACLLAFASARKPVVALGTLCLLLAQVGANASRFASSAILEEPSTGHPISTSWTEFRERYRWMEAAANQNLPIALLNSFDFFPTAFYASPNLVARMTYVTGSKADLNAIFFERLRTCCGVPLGHPIDIADFLGTHDTFLAFGGPPELHRLDELVKNGAVVSIRNFSTDHFLVYVTHSKNSTGGGPPTPPK